MCAFFFARTWLRVISGAGQHQHAVEPSGADCFLGDFAEVFPEGLLGDREAAPSERGDAARPCEEVLPPQHVVRDGHDVEGAGLTVEIDQLANAQASVAPRRVGVEVAQEERLVPGHVRA